VFKLYSAGIGQSVHDRLDRPLSHIQTRKVDDVYADQLKSVFTAATGLQL